MTEETFRQAAIQAERLHDHQRLFNAVNNNPNSRFHLVSGNIDIVIPMEFYGPLVVAIDKHIRKIKAEIEAL